MGGERGGVNIKVAGVLQIIYVWTGNSTQERKNEGG